MAAGANWASLLPGRNPSGTTVAGDYSIAGTGTGATSGANPLLPPTNLPAGAPASNPYSGVVVPTFGADSGPYTSTNLTSPGSGTTPTGGPSDTLAGAQSGPFGGMFSGMTQGGINKLFSSLSKTYGTGIGSLLANFLMSGAGFNQDAINNLFAALQPGIKAGGQSILDQFSTMGDRFGSDAMIGLSNYESQVQLNEGQIESQMYETSVQDFINTLMGTGGQTAQRIAGSPSTMDSILGGLNLGGSAASGLSSAISTINPAADTSILDAVSSLAGAF